MASPRELDKTSGLKSIWQVIVDPGGRDQYAIMPHYRYHLYVLPTGINHQALNLLPEGPHGRNFQEEDGGGRGAELHPALQFA